jgi:hypothetical protein
LKKCEALIGGLDFLPPRKVVVMNSTRALTKVSRSHGIRAAMLPLAMFAVAIVGFAPRAGAQGSSSPDFAGYEATPSGGLASASVTFVVPAITCTANDDTETAWMTDGVSTYTRQTYADVVSGCNSTGPYTWFQFGTPAHGYNEPGPAPGDTVVASLFQSGSATWAELHDLTEDVYDFANDSVNVGDTVVDIGSHTYANGLDSPQVPTFTNIVFSNATVNGDYLGFEGATKYNDVTSSDHLLLKTKTSSTTGAGTTFSLKFKNPS